MASIELRRVSVAASEGVRPLRDVSFAVPDGGQLALLGAPGAGNSTLLRMLVGLVEHASGDVVIGGELANLAEPKYRRLALVPADPQLHAHLDVFENLAFAAFLSPDHRAEEVAADVTAIAAELALTDLLGVRPVHLDAAQRQRVAVGRELIRDADAWLFDDAFGAQAERMRPHVRSVVTQWQRERGRTSIFATQSTSEAFALGEQMAVLHHGTVLQSAPVREIFSKPLNLVVASLTGAMNLLPARVESAIARTPLLSVPTDPAYGSHLVIGIRPEHLHVLAAGQSEPPGAAVFEATIGDVEFRGRDQLLFAGFESDAELDAVIVHLEDVFDFDMFQDFVAASVPANLEFAVGQQVRFFVDPAHVTLFDAESGVDATVIHSAGASH